MGAPDERDRRKGGGGRPIGNGVQVKEKGEGLPEVGRPFACV